MPVADLKKQAKPSVPNDFTSRIQTLPNQQEDLLIQVQENPFWTDNAIQDIPLSTSLWDLFHRTFVRQIERDRERERELERELERERERERNRNRLRRMFYLVTVVLEDQRERDFPRESAEIVLRMVEWILRDLREEDFEEEHDREMMEQVAFLVAKLRMKLEKLHYDEIKVLMVKKCPETVKYPKRFEFLKKVEKKKKFKAFDRTQNKRRKSNKMLFVKDHKFFC